MDIPVGGRVTVEVHARWYGRGGMTFCGVNGYAVNIRAPQDWELVTCPVCNYTGSKAEE